jgi:hypothetical protein
VNNPIVAFDESGNTGQNLLDSTQPVFVLASVHFSDTQAGELVKLFSPRPEHELHFKNLKRRESGRYKILSFLRSALISSETVKLNVFHKSFMVTTKIVDMLVEPLLAQGGVDLYKRGANLAMANVLHTATPVLCGQELFQTFQDCFVQMIRQRDRGTVETFYNSIVNLRAANTHDRFHSLLDTLIATQNILAPVLRQVTDTELDPAIPSLVSPSGMVETPRL